MPLQKLQLKPGVNRESTSLANEGTWFQMDKVRFRSGYPEKLGGWTKDTGTYYNNGTSLAPTTGSFWGTCRSLWNWVTLASYNLMGWTTSSLMPPSTLARAGRLNGCNRLSAQFPMERLAPVRWPKWRLCLRAILWKNTSKFAWSFCNPSRHGKPLEKGGVAESKRSKLPPQR